MAGVGRAARNQLQSNSVGDCFVGITDTGIRMFDSHLVETSNIEKHSHCPVNIYDNVFVDSVHINSYVSVCRYQTQLFGVCDCMAVILSFHARYDVNHYLPDEPFQEKEALNLIQCVLFFYSRVFQIARRPKKESVARSVSKECPKHRVRLIFW